MASSIVRVSAFLGLSALLAACSGSSKGSSPSGGSGNGAGGTAPVAEGPQQATEKGTIVELGSKKPVAGAKVTAGDQSTTTAADGSWSLTLQKGEKFQLSVTADGYAALLEQETSLDGDYDKGATTIVPQTTATLLTGMFDGYDSTLGILSIQVIPTGGCSTEDGSTIEVEPAGAAKIAYFVNGMPNAAATKVKGGEFPSAVFYNVQPGVQLSVTVKSSCTEQPFPVQQGSVLYTGGISAEAGEATAFARVFLQ